MTGKFILMTQVQIFLIMELIGFFFYDFVDIWFKFPLHLDVNLAIAWSLKIGLTHFQPSNSSSSSECQFIIDIHHSEANCLETIIMTGYC